MSPLRMLEGKTVVITGAGRNIGRAIAETFAEHEASIIVIEIDKSRAAGVIGSLATGAD